MWFLKVGWALFKIEQRQFLLISTQGSGKTLQFSLKTNVTALAVPTPSAVRCVDSGYVREDFTLKWGGWFRCCAASKVDEKFRTTPVQLLTVLFQNQLFIL